MAIGVFAGVAVGGVGMGLAGASTSSGDRAIFEPVTPARILDTRTGNGSTGKIGPGGTISVQVTGRGGVAADAVAVVLNVAATGATSASYLTIWPATQDMPGTSSLNFPAGETTSGEVTAKIGAAGKIEIYNNAGSTHVVADVVGYYRAHTHDDAYYTKAANDQRDVQQSELVGVAVLESGGVLLDQSRNYLSYRHTGTGTYEVRFTRSVTFCMISASLFFSGRLGGEPGTVLTSGWADVPSDTILVQTFDSTGAPANRSFRITGICNG
jgi:hypothetical protein